MPTSNNAADDSDITLRDILNHIQNLASNLHILERKLDTFEQKVDEKFSSLEKAAHEHTLAIHVLGKKVTENTEAIEFLTQRVDALDQDLNTTIMDSIKIRQHVGMAIPDDE